MIIYTVGKGDTLWDICKRFGAKFDDTMEINNIDHPDHIYPGMALNLRTAATEGKTYCVVQTGQTLWDISKKYRIPMETLVTINRLESPEHIYPGRLLLVSPPDKGDGDGDSENAKVAPIPPGL